MKWFADRYLSFCPFSFGHCVVSPPSIYGFWLLLLVSSNLYLHFSRTMFTQKLIPRNTFVLILCYPIYHIYWNVRYYFGANKWGSVHVFPKSVGQKNPSLILFLGGNSCYHDFWYFASLCMHYWCIAKTRLVYWYRAEKLRTSFWLEPSEESYEEYSSVI